MQQTMHKLLPENSEGLRGGKEAKFKHQSLLECKELPEQHKLQISPELLYCHCEIKQDMSLYKKTAGIYKPSEFSCLKSPGE